MNILVIGDVMIDRNYLCKTSKRTAPESANVPIYNIDKIEYFLGGAANVAKNLWNLKAHVEMISVIGDDEYADKITHLFQEQTIPCIFYRDSTRQTTIKNRIFENSVLVNRHDYETATDISKKMEDKILSYITEKIDSSKIDAILLIDYNKGLLTTHLTENIILLANEKKVYTFVDPKINNYLKYKNCFCFKPNLHEGQTLTGKTEPEAIYSALKANLRPTHIVLTCGENGMYLNKDIHITHPEKIPLIDVTGAGDTAMSTLVYMFLRDKCMIRACRMANSICGKSIQCIGNYNLTLADFEVEKSKIYTYPQLPVIPPGSNIVFTNGCFDLIHSAHIKLLNYAKKQGDVLMVGLNSDASIKRLKGASRPINNTEERAALLESLPMVDYIVVYEDDTPENIIQELRPQVLVKGGDYTLENIVGRQYVQKVLLFNYLANKSSSLTINRIIRTNQ